MGRSFHPDGDQSATSTTTSRDSNGNVTKVTITNTTYPLTGMITSTKTTTHIVNGVANETTETTNTYPSSTLRKPEVMTTTRSYVVSEK
jgi:hypothetical protein